MQGFFLDTALEETSLANPIHCSVLVAEPPQKGNWVIERWHSLWKKKKKQKNTTLPFHLKHYTGSPLLMTHPLRSLLNMPKLLAILYYVM